MKRKTRSVIGVLLLALASASAQAGTPEQGRLKGSLRLEGRSVEVDGTFDAHRATLHFAEPFACRVPADRVAATNGEHRYRFGTSANGGRFCDRLRGEGLSLTGEEPNLFLRVESPAGVWSGPVYLVDH